jgi:EpsI family protein
MKTKNTKFDINFILMLLFLGFIGMISWQLYLKESEMKDTVDIHQFPKSIAGWESEEMEITEQEYAILETRNAFARKYTHPDGRTAHLFIVYSQNNRKVSHPPEVCYTGSGLTILKKNLAVIELPTSPYKIQTNQLFVEQKNIRQLSYYWFKVGTTFTPNYWKQQFLIAFSTLTGQHASSALIRISTLKKENESGSEETLNQFTKLITPLLFQYLP